MWKEWGPYLSKRQWGTVREDYGSNGDAWNYFTHDRAQYRAYLWGEDGLAIHSAPSTKRSNWRLPEMALGQSALGDHCSFQSNSLRSVSIGDSWRSRNDRAVN